MVGKPRRGRLVGIVYSKGSVSVFRQKRRRGEGVVLYDPVWRGRVNKGSVYELVDGDGRPLSAPDGKPMTETEWKSLTKVFSDIECVPYASGKYKGRRVAEQRLDDWREGLEAIAKAELREIEAQESWPMLDVEIPDFLDEYIDTLVSVGGVHGPIAPKTQESYRSEASYCKSYFAGVKAGELTPAMLEEWKRHLNGPYKGGKPLADTTKSKTFSLMRRAYKHAVRMGTLPSSPFESVYTPPRSPSCPNPLTNQSYEMLKGALAGREREPLAMAALLALRTGMRQGEVCGLRWRDVDIETGAIYVCNAIGRGVGGMSAYEKSPKGVKGKNSARRIPGSPQLAELFAARRRAMEGDAADMGLRMSEDAYVIGDARGKFMNPSVLSKRWRGLSEGLGLMGTQGKRATFHDLRHTFASRALHAGVDVLVVAKILGHKDPALTLNVYADALQEYKDEAMKALDDAF